MTAQADDAAQVRSLFPSPGGAPSGPTALRIVLGSQLRKLREAKHITCEDAGAAIRGSHSKISRMELGRVSFRERDVADLLTLYGVTDADTRASLLGLADQANAPGWWHDYSDIMPGWFEPYVGLEDAATRIRAYEVQFIPGLLQTEEYIHAVTLLGHPQAPESEIDRRVELRKTRTRLLTGDRPPHLWAVVDEAALRRPLGGRAAMRRQLQHLIEVTSLPNVTLQIVPFDAGGHAAAGGPFSILRFSEPDLPDVVFLEQLTSALYLDRREDLDRYLLVMERLCVDASPAPTTPDLIHSMLNDS